MRVDQFCSCDQFSATIALVTLCVTVVAHGALTTDKSISKEALTLLAVLLIDNLFKGLVFLHNCFEDILSDLGLLSSTGTTETIEITIEPIVDLFMDCVVVITNLLACFSFLHRFGLCGGTVLVSAANVDSVMACKTSISGKHVS